MSGLLIALHRTVSMGNWARSTEDMLKAAYRGDIKAVKVAIKNGADNYVKDDGPTTLLGAVGKGHIKIVKILVVNGTD